MNAGEFKNRITIQQYDENAIDDSGFPLPESERYTDYKTVWAKILTLKSREYYQAKAIQAEHEVKFIVRYSKDLEQVDNKYRIKHKDRYYDIQSIVNDDFTKKTITIIAKERL